MYFVYIYIYLFIHIYIYDVPHACVCVVDSFVSIELFDLWVYHSLPLYVYIYTFIMYRHMQKVCICVHQEVVEHPCVFLSWRPRPSTLALLGAVVKSWSFELDDGEIWNKCINENWIIMVFCRCFSKPIHFHECCLIELARFCPSFKENERTCKIWTVVATCFSCVCVCYTCTMAPAMVRQGILPDELVQSHDSHAKSQFNLEISGVWWFQGLLQK